MSWKNNIRQASFRGVPFGVESHQADVAGRRLHVHEFHGTTPSWPEDMGPKARRFNIEAFVLGDNYMAARDALIRACEQAGSGTLVHPYLGSWPVHCEGCRLSETSARGRMAVLRLEFVVDGLRPTLSVKADSSSLMDMAVESGVAAVRNDFASAFSVSDLPAFVSEAAAADLNGVLDIMADGGLSGDVSRLIEDVRATIPALVQTPSELGTTVLQITKARSSHGNMSRTLVHTLERLAGFGNSLPSIPLTTATRLQQSINRSATISLVRRSGILEYARLLPSMTFTHKGETDAVRDWLGDHLDREMAVASVSGSDSVFEEFRAIRAVGVQHIRSREPGLARLISITIPTSEPALVSAYRLYADPGRADELVGRNRLRHPGFVPGGQALEALGNTGIGNA